jgi:hypothetical protein
MGQRPDPLSLIAEAVAGGTGRSELSRWLTKHHDEFAQLVEGEVNGTKVTEALVQAALVKPGTKPSATKRAWDRVKARVAKARARQPATAQALPAKGGAGRSPAKPVPAVVRPPELPFHDTEADEPARPIFTPVRNK